MIYRPGKLFLAPTYIWLLIPAKYLIHSPVALADASTAVDPSGSLDRLARRCDVDPVGGEYPLPGGKVQLYNTTGKDGRPPRDGKGQGHWRGWLLHQGVSDFSPPRINGALTTVLQV